MAPSAIAEVPVDKNSVAQGADSFPDRAPVPRRSEAECVPAATRSFLNDALLENHRIKGTSKTLDILVALLVHAVVIATPILMGLYFTNAINVKEFTATLLVAPSPPPPPPGSAAVKPQAAKHVFTNRGKLLAPTYIPQRVAEIKEAPLEGDVFEGVSGGVPGGVPGGQLGGVIGGVIGGMPSAVTRPIATNEARPKQPIRVGGRVRAPKLVTQITPQYPVLALQMRLTGDVIVDTILDEHGNVTDMKVVSGPPLLYQAALAALGKWKYEPTYLNDQPIPVQMVVTVRFRMPNG